MRPFAVIGVLWLAWLTVWIVSAVWTSRTEARPRIREEAPYRILTIAGAVLLGWNGFRMMGLTGAEGWSMVALVAMGIAFSLWARWHLGVLWSGTVTRKMGHRIVDSGPYALVRHPIYTGVITALIATAIAEGQPLALAGGVLFAMAFTMKARLEERFLREEFGAAYAAYAARTPMLIPFWPKAG